MKYFIIAMLIGSNVFAFESAHKARQETNVQLKIIYESYLKSLENEIQRAVQDGKFEIVVTLPDWATKNDNKNIIEILRHNGYKVKSLDEFNQFQLVISWE